MKPRINPWLASCLVLLALWGCQTAPKPSSQSAPNGQRLIKVSFRDQANTFRLRVNRFPVERIKLTEFTNVMTRLQLGYGDIVIWESKRDERGRELTTPGGIHSWWYECLKGTQCSFYSFGSDTSAEFFAIPVYHWTGPRDKPRPLEGATFYVDGEPLGRGGAGFCAMLDKIEQTKKGWITILAPRVANQGQESPWLADDQLLHWATKAGVSQRFEKFFYGRYTGYLDFARFGDPE